MTKETAMALTTLQVQSEPTDCFCGFVEQHQSAGQETILLVEDQEFVRRVACEILRAARYAVLSARNADEALRIFDQQPETVALLLTDVVLPGEDGGALARKLRQRNASLKVLFVTGYAEQMAVKAAEHEEFLAKPFCTAVLLRRVGELLRRCELEPKENKDAEGDREAPFRRACGSA